MSSIRLRVLLIGALCAMVCLFGPAQARADDANDPFARGQRAKPKPGNLADALAKLIQFKVTLSKNEVKPGEIFRLTLTGVPKTGFHTYPLTRRTPDQIALSRLSFPAQPYLLPLWDSVQESAPILAKNAAGEWELEHDKEFTWAVDFVVAPDAPPGP